ncbi:dephospho-CoA kinase [Pontibacter sp. JAM-7]|uniref:dephospho-CoA kinase n=1 Tax=Pontibacter sp. JAM-7 TaxID=3366581 RepID=UPI003AF80E9A
MKSPFVVGLTGGIGSGKTAVSDHLQALGISIVDADVVAREVVIPGSFGLQQITRHFGPSILDKTGELNRPALRQIIFADPAERTWLEKLLHPLIRQRIVQLLANPTDSFNVLSSPLLLETDQHTLTDYIVVVDLPENLQLQRTMQRDENSEAQVRAIIAAQMPRHARCDKADFILDNSGDKTDLANEIQRLMSVLNQQLKDSS